MSLKKVFFSAAMFLAGAGALYWKSVIQKSNGDFLDKRILTPDSYREITTKIRTTFTSKYWPEIKKSRDERRRCHPESGEYQNCVLNFQKTIKKLIEESTAEVLAYYRVPKEIFEESVNFYDSDPELKEFGENIVKPLSQENVHPKLNISDTNKILQYFSSRLKEKNTDCLEFDEYLVITSQIEDEIYKAYKIEIDEVNNAYEKYKDQFEDIVETMKQQTSSVLATADTSF